MKLLKLLICSSLFTLFINSSGLAQQTGSIKGQVFDSLGAIVTGAIVIAVDAEAKEKRVLTNQRGEFSINELAAGKYIVCVTAPRFGLYENPSFEVKAGAVQSLTVTLSIESIKENVQVDKDGQIDTDSESNLSAIVLKGRDLDYLPDDPDELQEALQALAGPAAGPEGAQFYIDGFSGGRMPPKSAIREIRINQNPFSAEYERLGFGNIEILTKPGSDKWSGQAFFNFNDESFNSRNPFSSNRASSQLRFFGGNVAGRLKKGKSSFFLDFSNRQIDDNRIVNATILNSSINIDTFKQEIIVPARRLTISPRIDYQINANNALVARYSFTGNKLDNQGVSDFSLPTRAFRASNTESIVQLTETAILNPLTVNETRFQFSAVHTEQTGDNSIPTINVSSAFIGGGGQVGWNFNDSRRWELQNKMITSVGKNNQHSIKFGERLRSAAVKDRSEVNFGGTFTFAGVRDPVTGSLLFSSIEQYRQKVLGNPDPRFNPSQFVVTTGNPLAEVSQYEVGLFMLDDWKVRRDLLLSFGLRYENQSNIGDNFNFAPRLSVAWSPEASRGKKSKTVFRGGAGIFFDRFGENFSLLATRFDGLRQLQYIVGSGSNILGQPVFTVNGVSKMPTAAEIAANFPGTSTVRRIADDLQAPRTYQFALSVERQFPRRTNASVTFISSRSVQMLRIRNINAPFCAVQSSVCAPDAARPDPAKGNIYVYESSGKFKLQQLLINVNSNFSPKISLNGNFRLGFAKSDTDGPGTFPAYSYNLESEYGASLMDIRAILFVRAAITLPWKIQLSPSVSATSSRPFNITTGIDTNRDSIFTERPTFTELSQTCIKRGLTASFCDISGFANPDITVIPRNYGRNGNYLTTNLTINKTFGFGARKTAAPQNGQSPHGGGGGMEAMHGSGSGGGAPMSGGVSGDNAYNLQIGLQITNLFNRNNQGAPIGNMSSDRFGQSFSTAGGFGPLGNLGGTANRRIELQLRFGF